jgi:hypothetical protein
VTLPNGTTLTIEPCTHQQSVATPSVGSNWSGWAAYAGYSASNGLSFFSADFNVPTEPHFATPDGMTYIFNGLEDSGGSYILQPVLQFSNYFTGGCQPSHLGQWEFRSFYVGKGTGNAHCGPGLAVTVGDGVTGVMKQLSEGTWQVWAGKDGSGFSLNVSDVKPQTWASLAVELWYPDTCGAYPGEINFRNSFLQARSGQTLSPSWVPHTTSDGPASQCGQCAQQRALVNGPGAVTIVSERSSRPNL